LSGTTTTTTKATELKSLQDGIDHVLQKRREDVAILGRELKKLTDHMTALAGPRDVRSTRDIDVVVVSLYDCGVALISGKYV
jgi:hypothetical protein